MASSACINWLFGRGLSMACGLTWSVPEKWSSIPRVKKIERIKDILYAEMDHPNVDTRIVKKFLGVLATNTSDGWRNRFITTNWDYLLQREILLLNLKTLPVWLDNSHVFHLNGTVEILDDNTNRSPFLLEEDSRSQRSITPEANIAYNKILWDRMFVVVGMSFECETDKLLLQALNRAEDEMPIGESTWIVVNRNQNALEITSERIQKALPSAEIKCVCAEFGGWLEAGLVELRECGVTSF